MVKVGDFVTTEQTRKAIGLVYKMDDTSVEIIWPSGEYGVAHIEDVRTFDKPVTRAWFSRHKPTAEQVAEMGSVDLDLTGLAQRAINTEEDLMDLLLDMSAMTTSVKGAVFLYGVVPTPLRAELPHLSVRVERDIYVWEAWNVQRTAEGGKPTFAHKQFLLTGFFPYQT